MREISFVSDFVDTLNRGPLLVRTYRQPQKKSFLRSLVLLVMVMLYSSLSFAQSWTNVGGAYSGERVLYNSMAIDGSGTPYVAFEEQTSSGKAMVKKYNGSSWVAVGSGFVSAGQAEYTSLAIDGSDTPYVAFRDYANGQKATVMKYNGSSWVALGSAGFSAGAATWTSLAIDGSGTPYVAYTDYANGQKATVMKYNGSSWVTVGSAGFSAGWADYISLAIDGSGAPYVAYMDVANGYRTTVMKYNGSSWVTVGTAGFSAGGGKCNSLAIDSSGTPYVAYKDLANSDKATVMKYNGSSWVAVGGAGFSPASIDDYMSLVIGSGTPYVAFCDYSWGSWGGVSVMKYNGSSWEYVGVAGFSSYDRMYPSLAIDGSGTLYVAYSHFFSSAYVMSFVASPLSATQSQNNLLCNGACNGSATVTASGGTAPYTYSWAPGGGTAATASGLCAGSYTCTITDNSSTVITRTFTITEPGLMSIVSITNDGPVCGGSDLHFSSVVSGGSGGYTFSWHGPNSFTSALQHPVIAGATVAAAGVYTLTVADMNGCTNVATTSVVVNPLPDAGTITGTTNVWVGSTITLSNSASGGTWGSGATGVATVSGGVVSGVAAGTAMISYTVTNSCGTANATKMVTVNALPTIGTTGAATVCTGSTITLSSSVTGGTWSTSASGVATISASGVVTGVATGTAVISYSALGTVATAIVTVNASPAAVGGVAVACPGATTTLTDATTGGTWSSADMSVATVGSTNGVVMGTGTGTATIMYTISNGCSRSAVVTINAPLAVTGTLGLCAGKTASLAYIPTAYLWSGSNTSVATIASGVVTGVATGVADITVTTINGCKTITNVTVSTQPPAISGTLATCVGATITLGNALTGGTWSSYAPGFASISSGGVVTGLVASKVTISYSSGLGCYRTGVVTVNAAPSIMGTPVMCVGTSATLSSYTGGGTWSSGDVLQATISSTGVVTGVSAGTATISYTLGSGCTQTAVATIHDTPDPIVGASSLCGGTTITLTNGVAGGSWSSSNTAYATVGTSGDVTGFTAGVATITYALGTCRATHVVTVNAVAVPITGTASVCEGLTTSLNNSAAGTWSSLDPAIATVSAGGIVTGVIAGNGTIVFTRTNGCQTTRVVTVNVCASRQAVTGVATQELNTQITMFPNPTNGMLIISTPESGTLGVLAVDGKEIASYHVAAGNTNVDLPKDLAAGVYICRFNGNEGSSAMVRLIYQP